jgi:hypothetical protein
LNNRGVVRFALERFAEAAEDYGRALALKPDYAEALYNNALALEKLSRFNDALTSLDRAIALNPDYPEAHNLRGNLLCALMQWEKALASYDRAVALAPAYADAVNNRGVALLQMKRLDEAIESHTRAIALKPDFAEAYYKRGLAKLLAVRFREGWADAEWRGRIEATVAERPKLALPEWRDEPPVGRRILVYAEQGWGDTIQFCRYLPLLAERGAKVTFLAPTRLLRLLKPLDETVRLIDAAHDQGLFDFQCALMSLPHRLGTDLENVPNRVPYLAAEKALADTWRARLGEGLKIGIAWQGNPKGGVDRGRSVPLGAFFPLARVSGARLIALQKNDGLEQLADLPPDVRIETPPAPFDEGPDAFVDSAAIMAALDLIVTTDTAIAHLAGALNRPVWLALRYVPDWRWLLEREDSPWYSGMRLFRQETPGDWTPMFARMAQELAALAKR